MILDRVFTKKQLLILSEVNKKSDTITSLLLQLSKENKIPLSTLKDNAKALREIGLVEFGDSKEARLTPAGKDILILLNCKGRNRH